MEHHDVIIVVAGVWGLCAAHTFLAIEPSMSLLIIDSNRSIGGVWSTEQLYPGLRMNSIQGYYEFTGHPMTEAGVGIRPRGLISGEAAHDYLETYAKRFDLVRRLRLRTRVLKASQNSDVISVDRWVLQVKQDTDDADGRVGTLSCKKLVIATGQACAPHLPAIKGLSSFNKPLFHSNDLGRRAQFLVNAAHIKDVTVVGASKSAHDAVYLFATAGKTVRWVIHPPSIGRGAVPMTKSYVPIGIWSAWVEALLMVRPLTWFGMAPWSKGDGFGWIRSFLHRTTLGHRLIKMYFSVTGNASAKTLVLAPGDTMMWYGTQGNVLNYDSEFYDVVNGDNVAIIPGDIERLSDGHVHIQTVDSAGNQGGNEPFQTDAIILATGWDYTVAVDLEPASKRLGWGNPVDPSADTIYPILDAQSDKSLFASFPLLKEAPLKPERRPSLTPWRLWRFLAPPSQVPDGPSRDLIFLNAITSYQTLIKCEITSLWAYAYLHNRLTVPTPSEQDVQKEVSLWTRFGKWRAPYGAQGKMADFQLDAVPYYDLLLRDLGLRSWRKGWGFLGEVFGGALRTEDFKGIVQEWMAKQGIAKAGVQKKTQ